MQHQTQDTFGGGRGANARLQHPDVLVNQSFDEKSPLMDCKMINMSAAVIEDSVLSQPDLTSCVRDDANSVSTTINMMNNMHMNQNNTPAPEYKKHGPSSVRMSEHSMQDKWKSNDSESMSQTQQSQRGTNRSKSPRHKRDKIKVDGGKRRPDHLDIVFKAISERPILDNMTREERIREKLKFFNLEKESLEQSKKRIIEKVSQTGTRFGPRESNMSTKKEGNTGKSTRYNPFEEMMAIEAEFGSIFTSQESMRLEEAKNASKWFPLFETISQKRKQENFEKMVQEAQKYKDDCIQKKQLELIKQQIARGSKNVAVTDMLKINASQGGGEKEQMDVSKMIAEEHRRAQNQRMQEIVMGIKLLSEKSDYDVHHIEGIKEFIGYKYPVEPSIDETGENIYDGILSKVNSQWQEGQLSDMKIRSKSRQNSPNNRTYQGNKWRQDSIQAQEFKQGSHRLTQRFQSRDSEMLSAHDHNVLSAMTGAGRRNKTQDRYATGQGQGGQCELVNIMGTKSVQPGIFDRLNSQRNAGKDGTPAGQNNFDLFSKQNSRDSMERVGALLSRNNLHKRVSPQTSTNHQPQPSPLNFLPQDDSFYISMQETHASPMARELRPKSRQQVFQQMMPQPPISDAQWKEHMMIKQVIDVDDLNTYAGELATEMRIYSVNRLENIMDNVNAIIRRLRQIKPKKKHAGKGKKRNVVQAAAAAAPDNNTKSNEDIRAGEFGINTGDDQQLVDSDQIVEEKLGESLPTESPLQEHQTGPQEPNEKAEIQKDDNADCVSAEEICDETEQQKENKEIESQATPILDETATPIVTNAQKMSLTEEKPSTLGTDLKVQEDDCRAFDVDDDDEMEEQKFSSANNIATEKATAFVDKNETETNIVQDDGERVNTTIERENAPEKTCEESTIERKSQLIMKTVNDREFDVNLIQKFNRNDYKKTKICRESLKPVLKALEQNDLVNFDFEWTQCFKYSIFQDDLNNEILPIIIVLKKFCRTNIGNRSLRAVLARKIVNLKLQFGIMDPEEMPTLQQEETKQQQVSEKPTLLINEDLAEQERLNNNLDREEGCDEAGPVTHDSSQVYQDSLCRFNEMQIAQNDELVAESAKATGLGSNPFSTPAAHQANQRQKKDAASVSGSASTFNALQHAFVPMTTASPASRGAQMTILPNRISTASQSKRKFAPKNAAIIQRRTQKDSQTGNTLPKLTGTLGNSNGKADSNSGQTADVNSELAAENERLIKTSHLKQRSKMAIGEIDDGSQLRMMPAAETASSCISPTLPVANQMTAVTVGPIRSTDQQTPTQPRSTRNKGLRKQPLGTRQQYATNDQVQTPLIANKNANDAGWPSLHERNKSQIIPGSLYTQGTPVVPTAPQTPSNYIRSGSLKQAFLHQQGLHFNKKKHLRSRAGKSQGASSMTKNVTKSPERQRQAENSLVEKILARRFQMRTERRQPATRTRTASSHQAMLNAMGYRSFGFSNNNAATSQTNRNTLFTAKKMLMSSVLPDNSALRALRANNQHNLSSPQAPAAAATAPEDDDDATAAAVVESGDYRVPAGLSSVPSTPSENAAIAAMRDDQGAEPKQQE